MAVDSKEVSHRRRRDLSKHSSTEEWTPWPDFVRKEDFKRTLILTIAKWHTAHILRNVFLGNLTQDVLNGSRAYKHRK